MAQLVKNFTLVFAEEWEGVNIIYRELLMMTFVDKLRDGVTRFLGFFEEGIENFAKLCKLK